jgi:lipopolysaccharide export system permease protein
MLVTKIDLYLSKLFLGFFLGGLLVFITLFLAVDALSSMVSYQGVSSAIYLQYYAYYFPEVLYRMLPIACVIATVFTLSVVNKSNELLALQSVGFSLGRVCFPLIFWTLFFCGFTLFLSDRVIPNFTKLKNYIYFHEIKKAPSLYSIVKNERIWYRSNDKIFNIKTLNEQTQRAQGLSLYYLNEQWDLIQMMTAKEVIIKENTWELIDGSVTIFSADSSFPLTSQFKNKTIPMEKDTKDLASSGNTSEILSISELYQFIQTNREAGLDTVRYEVDFHSKFGFALAPLIMGLLGIPFSVTRGRSGGVRLNLSVCLGLILLYWITYSSAITLGNYRQLPPILAAWMPNLVNGGLAVYLIKRKIAV